MHARIVEYPSPEWDDALVDVSRSSPHRPDVYFGSAYHAWHAEQGHALAVVVEDDRGVALFFAGLLLPIDGRDGAFDLQTPNGYGGPLARPGLSADNLGLAWHYACDLLSERGVVAMLFRLHPLFDQRPFLPPSARVIDDRVTVYVPIDEGAAVALAASDSRHRNMVSRGRRDAATVVWADVDSPEWAEFEGLYGDAMARLDARRELRYGLRYFQAMRESALAELAVLRDVRGLVAGSVFLWGAEFGHYHLSARRADAPNYAMNTLVHAGVERACQRRLQGLHLGGGLSAEPSNSLFRFKATIGHGRRTFRLARVVSDEARFRTLCAEADVARGRSSEWLLGYRDPA